MKVVVVRERPCRATGSMLVWCKSQSWECLVGAPCHHTANLTLALASAAPTRQPGEAFKMCLTSIA